MAEPRPGLRARFGHLLEAAGPVIGLLCVLAIFGVLEPSFLSPRNLITIAVQTTVVALAALGMTFVIASGGIDLSVGSQIALSGMTLAAALRAELPLAAAVGLGLGAGALAGLANGLLITGLRLQPFIASLGTMGIARGVAKWIGGERTLEPAAEQVAPLADLLVKRWSAPGLWLTLGLAMFLALVLTRTVFGLRVLAIGSNEATARLCGVPVKRTLLAVYTLSGAAAGLAGCLLLGRVGVGDPNAALGLELDVIAAVVIGGASLSGGSGSIAGSLIGALLMGSLATGCNLLGVPTYVQQMLIGAIILAAVALDQLRRRS